MFGELLRSGRMCVLLIAFLVLTSLFGATMQSAAQTDDPLALKTYLPGHDAEKSRAVLAEHMVGVWQVVHMDGTATPRAGQAHISADGDIKLSLLSGDGEDHYQLVEADAQHFELADGPFSGTLTARFAKISTGADGDPANPLDVKTTVALPSSASSLPLEKDEVQLNLPIVWREGNTPYLQVTLAVRDNTDRYEGQWNEEKRARLQTGGLATWVRGSPRIDQVFVVEDQLNPAAGKVYPFTPERVPRGDPDATQRTLLVIGEHLPEMSDQAALASQSEAITYAANFKSGMDRDRAIAETLSRVKFTPPDGADMLLVTAGLTPGVTSGRKELTVNGAAGVWNLLFSDGFARFNFARGAGEASDVFYESDIGYVELHLVEDIPIDEIELELFVGTDRSVSAGVISASRAEDQGDAAVEGIRYRSDPIHFFSLIEPNLTPPENRDALRVGVRDRMHVRAVPIDPAQIVTLPRVAEAKIEKHPFIMGDLWKSALDRAAACNKTTVSDYEAFQDQPFGSVDNFIVWDQAESAYKFFGGRAERGVGEDWSRSISIQNGDMAAALLIRDELVGGGLAVIGQLRREINDTGLMRAARQKAQQNPAIAENLFWSKSAAPLVLERSILPDRTIDYTLDDTLDVEWIANRHGMTLDAATAWAESKTVEAAHAYVNQIESSLSTALNADPCNIGELFDVAGHRAPRLVNAILPRLMKFQRDPQAPENGHWVPDRIAQGYVKSLHTKVGSVRALDDYASADTRAVTFAVAAMTGIVGAGARLFSMAAIGAWAYFAGAGIDMAIGLLDAYDYYQGEQYFEYAKGIAPISGENVYYDASAARSDPIMTGVGLILPVAGGASAVSGLRHFKTIRRGMELLDQNPQILRNLSALPDEDARALAAYYGDLMRHSKARFTRPMSAKEQANLDAFKDYFRTSRAFNGRAATDAARVADAIEATNRANRELPPRSMDDSFDELNIGTPDNPANTGGTRPVAPDIPNAAVSDDSFAQLDLGPPESPLGTRPVKPDAPVSTTNDNSFAQIDLGPPESPLGTGLDGPDAPLPTANDEGFAQLDLGSPDRPLGTRPGEPDAPRATAGNESIDVPPPTGDPRLDPAGRNIFEVIDDMPVDDSPPLPRPELAETDLSTLRPGLISRNLSDTQVEQLFDPLYKPEPHEIILKADLIRSGRVPLNHANGDPETLDALADAFRLEPGWRRPNRPNGRPSTPSTSGESTIIDAPPDTVSDTTIIEASPGSAGTTTLIEASPGATGNTTLIDPPPPGASPTANPDFADTEIISPPDVETLLLPAASETTLPPGPGPPAYQPPPISNPQIRAQLDGIEQRQMQDLLNGVPGTFERQKSLELTRGLLSRAPPEQLRRAVTMDRAMRRLGVQSEQSLSHAALFNGRRQGGFSEGFTNAEIIAEGILRYGSRPVTMAEFVDATGLSPIAARVAADEAARFYDLEPTRTSIIPLSLR